MVRQNFHFIFESGDPLLHKEIYYWSKMKEKKLLKIEPLPCQKYCVCKLYCTSKSNCTDSDSDSDSDMSQTQI
jgi:hypothetical protein